MATDLDALNTLIVEVRNFMDTLAETRKSLMEAAAICDQTMGSDLISQREIARLETAIQEINKAGKMAYDVEIALLKDKERLMII